MKKNMDVEWGYTGERGPEHWAELCDWFAKGAAFELQSPIPLTTCEPAKDQSDTIAFHYQKQRFTDKEFKNGLSVVNIRDEKTDAAGIPLYSKKGKKKLTAEELAGLSKVILHNDMTPREKIAALSEMMVDVLPVAHGLFKKSPCSSTAYALNALMSKMQEVQEQIKKRISRNRKSFIRWN